MSYLECATTTITSLTATPQFFGFIPPHGKVLSIADGPYQVLGSIWARQRNFRSMQALESALDDRLVVITTLPSAPCPVEEASSEVSLEASSEVSLEASSEVSSSSSDEMVNP